jgi:CDP-diacylglycerol pyrophosphatase
MFGHFIEAWGHSEMTQKAVVGPQAQSEENENEFLRRDFIKLSGVVVASGITGLSVEDAFADKRSSDQISACAEASAWCEQKPRPSPCGSISDTDALWKKAQGCAQNPSDPSCRPVPGSNSEYVVVNGQTGGGNNYLLLATCRITGIECPMLWQSNAPNYWKGASAGAKVKGVNLREPYGFGINSTNARSAQQFHIHMAPLQNTGASKILPQLTALKPNIVGDKRDWINRVVVVTGVEANGDVRPRPYRALWVQDLDHNLFDYLFTYIAKPLATKEKTDPEKIMPFENLVVIPEDPAKGTGFFVLNSDGSLRDSTGKLRGVSAVDQLFYWG